jgi:hypothetical protein
MVVEFLRHSFGALSHSDRSSGFSVLGLVKDWPEFYRRVWANRVPSAAKAVLDRFPRKDYHRDPDPELNLPTVFLRHGYFTGASCLFGIGKTLEGYGIDNHQYDFTHPLDALTRRFLSKVEDRVEASDREVCAVGHSKGAAIILGAYRKRPDLFDKIVTMGVPYFGSERSHGFRFVESLWELRPESELIHALSDSSLPEDAEILNLYTLQDEFISPAKNSILPEQKNVRNLCFPELRHNSFLYDSIVQQVVRLFLDDVPFDSKYLGRLEERVDVAVGKQIDKIALVNDLS